jgi:hypothetical protein
MTITTFQQLPSRLDIEVGLGDDWSPTLTIAKDMAGYVFSGAVTNSAGAEIVITITVTQLTPTAILRPTLTDAQITALGVGVFPWYIKWTVGGVSRRSHAGEFRIREKQ